MDTVKLIIQTQNVTEKQLFKKPHVNYPNDWFKDNKNDHLHQFSNICS